MKSFSLIWHFGKYPNTKAGRVMKVSEDVLMDYLDKIGENSGSLQLDLDNEISIITVEFENKKYMVSYGYEKDADWHACAFIANKTNNSIEEFRGDYWSGCLIFDDLNLVKKMFLDFFHN